MNNNQKDKEHWIKKERKMREIIWVFIISCIVLIALLIFYPTKIWAIITSVLANISLLVKLILDLISISNIKKEK